MEGSDAESDLNWLGDVAQEVSEENNFSILPRNHTCDILAKNMTAFYPCLKSVPEAKVKSS